MTYKHKDSYYLKDKYQTDMVYQSDYLVTDKSFFFKTMIDHFSKYNWIVVMSDKILLLY